MTRQVIPITVEPAAYPDLQAAAAALPLGWVQADPTGHSEFASVGREVLLAWNRDTATNEVQTITTAGGTITAGTFLLVVVLNGVTYTTAPIVFGATPAAVQAALLAATDQYGTALATRYPATPTANTAIVCTGTNLPAGTVTVTFRYALAGQVIAVMTVDNAGLTGGTLGVTEGTPGAGGHAVSLTSTKDALNRTADFSITVGAGNIECFPFFQPPGWRQVDNNIYFTADSNNIWFAVVRTPSQ